VIRVCLADDQALVRSGIRALLEASGQVEVVAEAGDGLEAIEVASRFRPDVVILDVRMPKLDGIATLLRLKARDQEVRAILLSTFDDDDALVAGIRAGAMAFMLKDVEIGPLLQTIHRVAAGENCMSGVPAERLVDALQRVEERDTGHAEQLTQRERHVLGLMCAGLGNQDIADSLDISLGTVKNHVSVILAKLRTTDRTKAVLRAIKDRLV
jgi:DNA-binding NarL/FixJ family response regulator